MSDHPAGSPDARPEIDDPALLDVARELESYAHDATPQVPPGLTDRILAAVGREPPPSPLTDLAHALAPAGWRGLPMTLRAVARLAAGVGRPATLALRVEALGVLLAIALLGLGGGTALVVGAQAVVHAVTGPPAPQTTPVPAPSPALTPTLTPTQAPPPSEPAVEPPPPSSPPAIPTASPAPVASPAHGAEGTAPQPTRTPSAAPGGEASQTPEPSTSAGPGETPEPSPTGEATPAPGSTPPDEGATASPSPTPTSRPGD